MDLSACPFYPYAMFYIIFIIKASLYDTLITNLGCYQTGIILDHPNKTFSFKWVFLLDWEFIFDMKITFHGMS